MGKTTKETGYLLRLSPYKEKDAMALIIRESGFLSFGVHGAYDPKSKNAASLNPLSYAEYVLSESKGGKWSLNESNLIRAPRFESDLALMGTYQLFAEGLAKTSEGIEEKDAYLLLDTLMKQLEKGYDPISASFLFMCRLATLLGSALNTEGCLVCGKKTDITAFSFEEGGFLCAEHMRERMVLETSQYRLKMARYGFKAPLSDYGRVSFEKDDAIYFIEHLAEYLKDETGVFLRSPALLGRL